VITGDAIDTYDDRPTCRQSPRGPALTAHGSLDLKQEIQIQTQTEPQYLRRDDRVRALMQLTPTMTDAYTIREEMRCGWAVDIKFVRSL
jgi:hypothetical protein